MSAVFEVERAAGHPLLLDRFLPEFDVTVFNHLVVDADPWATFSAIDALDLAETVRGSAALRGIIALRGLPIEVLARVRGKPAPAPPARMLLRETRPEESGFTLLGEEPGRELCVGAIGVFWTPDIAWLPIEPDEFAGFDEPGYGKIAWNFSVLPYGERRSLVTTECRTATTDPESRRAFLRYWRVVGPFASYVMRANLPVIRRHAEAG